MVVLSDLQPTMQARETNMPLLLEETQSQSMKHRKEQAGAELCQAQSTLQLNLANYKLSPIQLNSRNQHSDHYNLSFLYWMWELGMIPPPPQKIVGLRLCWVVVSIVR